MCTQKRYSLYSVGLMVHTKYKVLTEIRIWKLLQSSRGETSTPRQELRSGKLKKKRVTSITHSLRGSFRI